MHVASFTGMETVVDLVVVGWRLYAGRTDLRRADRAAVPRDRAPRVRVHPCPRRRRPWSLLRGVHDRLMNEEYSTRCSLQCTSQRC